MNQPSFLQDFRRVKAYADREIKRDPNADQRKLRADLDEVRGLVVNECEQLGIPVPAEVLGE